METITMLAMNPGASLAAAENAVSDTVRRVNIEALDLMTRRAEINRRIRSLQQLMHGLRDLAAKSAPSQSDAAPPLKNKTQRWIRLDAKPPHDVHALFEHSAKRQPPLLQPNGGVSSIERLARACRIALLEVEGCASADEIRSRIVRRESFHFSDSTLSRTETIQTLTIMAAIGKIIRLENGSGVAYRRITAEGAPVIPLCVPAHTAAPDASS
jgi:hypothetical protein